MTTKRETIGLVAQARERQIAAQRAGDDHAGLLAGIASTGAGIADKMAADMRLLIGKLQEAITAVENATSVKDAYLGVSWLRTSTWNDVQEGIAKLEILSGHGV